jgi:hypothetical protein
MNKRLLTLGLLFISMNSFAEGELLIADKDIVVKENTARTQILGSDKGINCYLVTRSSNFEKKAEKGSQFVVTNNPSSKLVKMNKDSLIEQIVLDLRSTGLGVSDESISDMKKQKTTEELKKYLESNGIVFSRDFSSQYQMSIELRSLKTQSNLNVSCVSSSIHFTYENVLEELLRTGDLKPSTDL